MTPAVSVIIPTYNREERLQKTIESVLSQTYTDFELLICDDGSTDRSREMVAAFSDSRIRWIAGENSGGPATPRNRGIRKSTAEWLAFLDSDDLWEPGKLARQIEVVTETRFLAVCTNAKVLQDGKIKKTPYLPLHEDKVFTFEEMLMTNYVICSSMLIRKSIVEQTGGFPEEHHFKAIEDYALWLSASMRTDIYFLADPLTIYRDEPHDSIRGDFIEDELVKYNRILKECLKRVSTLPRQKSYFVLMLMRAYLRKNVPSLKKRIYMLVKSLMLWNR